MKYTSMIKGQHGGVRKPGPGKTIGRPIEVEDGHRYGFYLDPSTIAILDAIAPTRSKAIRLLAAQYKPAQKHSD